MTSREAGPVWLYDYYALKPTNNELAEWLEGRRSLLLSASRFPGDEDVIFNLAVTGSVVRENGTKVDNEFNCHGTMDQDPNEVTGWVTIFPNSVKLTFGFHQLPAFLEQESVSQQTDTHSCVVNLFRRILGLKS